MISLFIQLVIAIWLLSVGADWFTRAAALLTQLTGLSRLLLGAVLIGLTTNIPELAVSVFAVWGGQAELALANPIGSNIANTGLVLGFCLLIGRAKIEEAWLRAHGIPMLVFALLLYAFMLWGDLTFLSGCILMAACVWYTWSSIAKARQDPEMAKVLEESASRMDSSVPVDQRTGWTATILLCIMGGFVVLLSSQWVLNAATELARVLQVSESVIGLSVIALGTSLPELATAISAMRKGHHDTSLGIVLGSNIYNILGVIGLSAMVGTLPITDANRLFDLPVMLLVLLIPFLGMMRNRLPGRQTGLILLTLYGAYFYSLYTVYGIFKL